MKATNDDKVLRQFLSGRNRLHRLQHSAILLQRLLLRLSEDAHMLFVLSNEGTGIDDVLRGEMQGCAKIVSDIVGNLSSAIELDADEQMCRCSIKV